MVINLEGAVEDVLILVLMEDGLVPINYAQCAKGAVS